jgi:hypothetical protein
MKCSRCQHENPSAVKFCGECGSRLETACTSCGASNPPGNKFCGQCGALLVEALTSTKFASPQTYTPKHLAEKILTSKSALEGAMGETLARVQTTGERFYEAELHRIKGELLLGQTTTDEREAEAYFQNAIKVARGQSAKSLELRAAMSLSRLWQRKGKTAEARQLLAEIYGWFTEGFDTADLKEAKALLEELS